MLVNNCIYVLKGGAGAFYWMIRKGKRAGDFGWLIWKNQAAFCAEKGPPEWATFESIKGAKKGVGVLELIDLQDWWNEGFHPSTFPSNTSVGGPIPGFFPWSRDTSFSSTPPALGRCVMNSAYCNHTLIEVNSSWIKISQLYFVLILVLRVSS